MSEEDVEMDDSAVDEDDGPVFKVDEILGTRVKKNIRYYKVRWTDTWETEENLHECQEAIDAFWERTGGKDKAKPPIVVNTEDPPTGGKAYPLRQSKDEQSSKKKRKGTSKKIQRLKKRKLQGNESSSDEENGDESDNTDAAGGKSSLPSPQIGAKKVKRLKSKKMKNMNKDLFASEEGGATDDGDDGDDEDDSVPLKQLLAPASTTKTQGGANSMQAECPPKETLSSAVGDATGSALTSTDPVSQVPESSAIPDESQITNPNEAGAAAQDEELAGVVPSAATETVDSLRATTTTTTVSVTSSTAISTAASTGTTTTTTTTNRLVDVRSYDRLKWQRLGREKKSDAITCASESEEEQLCLMSPLKSPEPKSEPTPYPEVKVKEEPLSDEEGNNAVEDNTFKRTAKIKASFVIRRYCETGGDDENDLHKSDSEEYAGTIKCVSEENKDTNDDAWVPRIEEPFSHDVPGVGDDNEFVTTHPIGPDQGLDPLEFRPSMVSPSFTGSCQGVLGTPNTNSNLGATVAVNVANPEHNQTVLVPRFPPVSTAISAPTQPIVVDLTPESPANVSPPLFNVVQSVPGNKVKSKIARVVFLVRKLIDALSLKPAQVHEYVEALIAKAVVFTVRESYIGGKPDALLLEKQINDLTEIVLTDIPYERLMTLLYGSSHSKGKPPEQISSTSFSALSSALSVPIAQPTSTRNKIVPRAVTANIHSNSPTMLVPHVPRLSDVETNSQMSVVSPNHATMIATPLNPCHASASPITFGQHAWMESMRPPTSPVVVSSSHTTEVASDSTQSTNTDTDTIILI